jgi:hypothetical protein
VTLPIGIHPTVSAARYHTDTLCDEPPLFVVDRKTILSKTPKHAWQDHVRLNPMQLPRDEDKFDLGTVAHELILGKGAGFDVCEFDSWTTKAAKEARKASRAAGRTPILEHQADAAVLARVGEIDGCNGAFEHGFAETVLIWMIDWRGPEAKPPECSAGRITQRPRSDWRATPPYPKNRPNLSALSEARKAIQAGVDRR